MRPSSGSTTPSLFPLHAARLLAVVALVAVLGACSMFGRKGNTIDTMPLEPLYNRSHSFLEAGNYSGAVRAFQRLIARFPSGPYSE